jgi:ribosome-binding factor A
MSRRIERVRELIKREIAMIVARDVGIKDVLLTITRVEISPDVQYADIYITTIPKDATEHALRQLTHHVVSIQQTLNKRLRMRPVPKIRFLIDEGEQEAAQIDEIIHLLDEENHT